MALRLPVDRIQQAAVLVTVALFSGGYAAIGLLVMLAAVIAEAVSIGHIPWSRSAVDLWLVAFLGTFLVSGLFSPYRPIAVGSAGLAALAIYLSLGTMQRVLRKDQRMLTPILWAWVGGAVGTLVLVLVAYNPDVAKQAVTPALGSNAVGTTMLVALMLGIAMIMVAYGPRKYLALLCVAVTTALLALTFSRGALLGAAAGLAIMGALIGKRLIRSSGILIVILALAVVATIDPIRNRIVDRITRLNDRSTTGRIAIAQSAVEMFLDHPILGTGLNTFAAAYPAYRRPGEPHPGGSMPFAHNVWLNIAVEGGVIGVIAFAGLLLTALRSGWQWYRASGPSGDGIVAAAILAAIAGLFVQQLFDGTIWSIHIGAGLWMLIGILTSRPRAPVLNA